MGELLLIVALAAPLAGAAGAVLASGPGTGRQLQRTGCVVAAVAWAALAARGRFAAAGWFHTIPLLAAAGCGAALLAASDREPAMRRSLAGAALALTLLVGGLSAGERQVSALPALAGLAGCALLALGLASDLRDRDVRRALAVAAGGIVLTAVAFFVNHDATGRWDLALTGSPPVSETAAIVFLAAAAVLATAGTLQAGRAGALLLAGGLAVGLLAAPLRVAAAPVADPGAAESLVVAVVVLAVAATVAAAAGRAVLALALLALCVAAGPVGFVGPSRLLAAAAVLILAVDRRPSWLLGVPGGVALAVVATQVADGMAVALAVATGVVAALLGLAVAGTWSPWRRREGTVDPRPPWGAPDLASLPAAAVGAWLFLAPASWSWAGPTGLEAYDLGAARAAAAGLVVVVTVLLRDQLGAAAMARAVTGPKPPRRPKPPVRAEPEVLRPPAPRPAPRPPPDEAPALPPIPASHEATPGPKGMRGVLRRRARRRAAAREERGLP
jgi:hypothetical protein